MQKKIKSKRNFCFQQYESIIGKYVPLYPGDNLQNKSFNLENEWTAYKYSCEKLNFTRDFPVFIFFKQFNYPNKIFKFWYASPIPLIPH